MKNKTTAVAQTAPTTSIEPIQVQYYRDVTKENIEALIKEAKTVKTKEVGLPSPDSIEYYSIDDKLQIGESARFTYVARTVEARTEKVVDEETGEMVDKIKPLGTVIFIDEEGDFYKNSSYMFVAHFSPQESGYQAEYTFKGLKKTQNGNRMHNGTFKAILN